MTIETRHATLTPGHADNRFAILRSIVDGEWLPAPLFDTRAEAVAYMLGFDAACDELGAGASTLILDLATGEVGALDALDEDDFATLRTFVAEAFGIVLGGDPDEEDEPSQEEIEVVGETRTSWIVRKVRSDGAVSSLRDGGQEPVPAAAADLALVELLSSSEHLAKLRRIVAIIDESEAG